MNSFASWEGKSVGADFSKQWVAVDDSMTSDSASVFPLSWLKKVTAFFQFTVAFFWCDFSLIESLSRWRVLSDPIIENPWRRRLLTKWKVKNNLRREEWVPTRVPSRSIKSVLNFMISVWNKTVSVERCALLSFAYLPSKFACEIIVWWKIQTSNYTVNL